MMKIHIPKPCHEDWNLMTPKEKGRHCDVCAKVVVDFTQMTDNQIVDYFQKNTTQKTCGHFKTNQILQKQKIYIDIANLPKNIPFKNLFLACFMAIFSSLFFISCHSNNTNGGIIDGEVAIVDSAKIKEEMDATGGAMIAPQETQGKICVVDSTAKK